jgi:N4-gp56 family major capsid protein
MSNTSSINSELFANLVGAAQFAAYESSVARQLTTVFDLPANSGKTVQVPVWAGISAETITDESAATAKATNTTSASITMKEHVVYHRVTDMLRDSAYNDVLSQLGDQSGRAIAEAMDTQAFAEFANFGGSTTAIAVADFDIEDVMDRVAAIRGNKVTGPFFAVIHPLAANALKKKLTAAGSYTALAFALQNQRKKLAKGGIVLGRKDVTIGEAGPEAVIPLSGANSVGMGATYNIVVNAGIGTSGAQVGREIVDAIKKFEKTSGPVFASA